MGRKTPVDEELRNVDAILITRTLNRPTLFAAGAQLSENACIWPEVKVGMQQHSILHRRKFIASEQPESGRIVVVDAPTVIAAERHVTLVDTAEPEALQAQQLGSIGQPTQCRIVLAPTKQLRLIAWSVARASRRCGYCGRDRDR
jgi:hypothetical protein